jgi:hypothetical protein
VSSASLLPFPTPPSPSRPHPHRRLTRFFYPPLPIRLICTAGQAHVPVAVGQKDHPGRRPPPAHSLVRLPARPILGNAPTTHQPAGDDGPDGTTAGSPWADKAPGLAQASRYIPLPRPSLFCSSSQLGASSRLAPSPSAYPFPRVRAGARLARTPNRPFKSSSNALTCEASGSNSPDVSSSEALH